ncbi:MAG: hypothetical protein ABII74_01740 [Elusimicrobiota bacterium]
MVILSQALNRNKRGSRKVQRLDRKIVLFSDEWEAPAILQAV